MSPGLPSPPFCRKFTCKARWENWTRQTCRQTSTRSTSSKKIRGPEKSTSSPQGDEEEQWQRQDRKGRCSSVACSALCLKLLLCCCLLSRNFDVALEALNNHSVGDGAVGLFHRDGLDRLQSLLCCGGAGQSHFEDRRELNLKFPCLEASSHLNLANSCGNWLDKTMSDQVDFFLQAEAETVSERKGIKKNQSGSTCACCPRLESQRHGVDIYSHHLCKSLDHRISQGGIVDDVRWIVHCERQGNFNHRQLLSRLHSRRRLHRRCCSIPTLDPRIFGVSKWLRIMVSKSRLSRAWTPLTNHLLTGLLGGWTSKQAAVPA